MKLKSNQKSKKIWRYTAKHIGVIPLVISIILFTFPAIANAQNPPPVWWQNLHDNCDDYPQKYRGVEYCTGIIITDSGETRTVHVIVIDLHESDLRLEYIIAWGLDRNDPLDACINFENPSDCPSVNECQDVNRWTKTDVPRENRQGCDDPSNRYWYPVLSLEQAIIRAQQLDPNVAVVIDSDYGARTGGGDKYRDHGPQGLTVVRGNRLDGPLMGDFDNQAAEQPWLAVSEPMPTTPNLRAEIHQLRSEEDYKSYKWIYTGVGGGPWLIQSGEVKRDVIDSCMEKLNSCRDGASQVAVGLSSGSNPRWLFFVLAEKPNEDDNLLFGLADFMRNQLDIWLAFKFDGGGSSQLWYEGLSTKNGVVYREEMRDLSQYLAIIAEPGSGIALQEKPQIRLFERLLEWWHKTQIQIYRRWQGFMKWWDETLNKIKDLQQMIEDIQDPEWWHQQIENWLLQCFGSLLLSVGIVTSFWARRKRKTAKLFEKDISCSDN